jgi:hypothetical protein
VPLFQRLAANAAVTGVTHLYYKDNALPIYGVQPVSSITLLPSSLEVSTTDNTLLPIMTQVTGDQSKLSPGLSPTTLASSSNAQMSSRATKSSILPTPEPRTVTVYSANPVSSSIPPNRTAGKEVSSTARIGIGVGVAVTVVVLLFSLLWKLFFNHTGKSHAPHVEEQSEDGRRELGGSEIVEAPFIIAELPCLKDQLVELPGD